MLQIIPSTPQTNSSDCGVFATAYAVELMTGYVSGVQACFDVAHMRSHLEVCLEARELREQLIPFPRDLAYSGNQDDAARSSSSPLLNAVSSLLINAYVTNAIHY